MDEGEGVMLDRLAATVNVGRKERWMTGAAGTALVVAGLRQRNPVGLGLAAAGATLLYRAAAGHCPVYQRLGIDHGATESTKVALGGERGVHVVEQITIARPASEVYRFWRTLSNLPQFMGHLESVTEEPDGNRSHWTAKGPLGTHVHWHARIINEVPNQVIGWQSEEGSDVPNAGSVNFEPGPDGASTIVRVKLQYDPPAGKVGTAVARLFGEEPSQQVREDLQRLKTLLEGVTNRNPVD